MKNIAQKLKYIGVAFISAGLLAGVAPVNAVATTSYDISSLFPVAPAEKTSGAQCCYCYNSFGKVWKSYPYPSGGDCNGSGCRIEDGACRTDKKKKD